MVRATPSHLDMYDGPVIKSWPQPEPLTPLGKKRKNVLGLKAATAEEGDGRDDDESDAAADRRPDGRALRRAESDAEAQGGP